MTASENDIARDFLRELGVDPSLVADKPLRPPQHEFAEATSPEFAECAKNYANNPDKFFNSKPPEYGVKHEKPEHRVMIFLKAHGFSNLEIAEKTGYSPVMVSQILRQPWARERLITEISKSGRDVLSELIKGTGVDSVMTLVELRDDKNAPAAVRKACASDLIDRILGKPTQHIESDATVRHVSTEIGEVDRELQSLETELKRISHN